MDLKIGISRVRNTIRKDGKRETKLASTKGYRNCILENQSTIWIILCRALGNQCTTSSKLWRSKKAGKKKCDECQVCLCLFGNTRTLKCAGVYLATHAHSSVLVSVWQHWRTYLRTLVSVWQHLCLSFDSTGCPVDVLSPSIHLIWFPRLRMVSLSRLTQLVAQLMSVLRRYISSGFPNWEWFLLLFSV